jgi:hypothetical protein
MVRVTEQEWQTAMHEAGHACAAIVQGLPVSLVRRWAPDTSRELGATYLPGFAEDLDREKVRKAAIMVLCGPIMGDEDPPDWPLSDTNTSDERLLKLFCEHLGLTHANYHGLCAEAYKLTTTQVFCDLFAAVTGFFETFPTLDRRILREACRIAVSEG